MGAENSRGNKIAMWVKLSRGQIKHYGIIFMKKHSFLDRCAYIYIRRLFFWVSGTAGDAIRFRKLKRNSDANRSLQKPFQAIYNFIILINRNSECHPVPGVLSIRKFLRVLNFESSFRHE